MNSVFVCFVHNVIWSCVAVRRWTWPLAFWTFTASRTLSSTVLSSCASTLPTSSCSASSMNISSAGSSRSMHARVSRAMISLTSTICHFLTSSSGFVRVCYYAVVVIISRIKVFSRSSVRLFICCSLLVCPICYFSLKTQWCRETLSCHRSSSQK